MTLEELLQTASEHFTAGDLPASERICRAVLAVHPTEPTSLHLLGLIADRAGRPDAAVDLMARSLQGRPDWAAGHFNLGVVLEKLGRLDGAIAAFGRATDLAPELFEAIINLGTVLQRRTRPTEAAAVFRRAVALRPGSPEAHCNLAAALNEAELYEQAIDAARSALSLRPDYAKAYNNLGIALMKSKQYAGAFDAYHRAIELDPNLFEAFSSLGGIRGVLGDTDGSVAAYRRAVELNPQDAKTRSMMIFMMQYSAAVDPESLAGELREWDHRHGRRHAGLTPFYANDRDPRRRLRIGLLSADFRNHPVAAYLLPVLKGLDPGRVETFSYSNSLTFDQLSEKIRAATDHWRGVYPMSDDELVDLIRRDRIDLLVDLGLHTADNRLPVLARKPAPVQVSWLGYPGGTGLSSIDFRLSDRYLDPPTSNPPTDRPGSVVLLESFWCFDPPDPHQYPPAPLQATENGFVTFGCLNNFGKINDTVLDLWARVMLAVQDSKLLVLAPEAGDRQHLVQQMDRSGIDPARIGFVPFLPRHEYMRTYDRIDIALDTLPYSGHTTTCDALWMGVPVITLAGQTPVGRGGLSILSNAGLPELTALSQDQYIEIATDLARDPTRLTNLRSSLRDRLQRSTLTDGLRAGRHLETAFRWMWQHWCVRDGPASAGGPTAIVFRPE